MRGKKVQGACALVPLRRSRVQSTPSFASFISPRLQSPNSAMLSKTRSFTASIPCLLRAGSTTRVGPSPVPVEPPSTRSPGSSGLQCARIKTRRGCTYARTQTSGKRNFASVAGGSCMTGARSVRDRPGQDQWGHYQPEHLVGRKKEGRTSTRYSSQTGTSYVLVTPEYY